MAKIPSDPGVARGALPGRRRETQQRQPLALPGGDISQGVPDFRQRAQVVMGVHQGLEAHLLGCGDGLEDDLAQVHALALGLRDTEALFTRAAGQCPGSRTTAGWNSECGLARFSPAVTSRRGCTNRTASTPRRRETGARPPNLIQVSVGSAQVFGDIPQDFRVTPSDGE
jgi:hypothetical protein